MVCSKIKNTKGFLNYIYNNTKNVKDISIETFNQFANEYFDIPEERHSNEKVFTGKCSNTKRTLEFWDTEYKKLLEAVEQNKKVVTINKHTVSGFTVHITRQKIYIGYS